MDLCCLLGGCLLPAARPPICAQLWWLNRSASDQIGSDSRLELERIAGSEIEDQQSDRVGRVDYGLRAALYRSLVGSPRSWRHNSFSRAAASKLNVPKRTLGHVALFYSRGQSGRGGRKLRPQHLQESSSTSSPKPLDARPKLEFCLGSADVSPGLTRSLQNRRNKPTDLALGLNRPTERRLTRCEELDANSPRTALICAQLDATHPTPRLPSCANSQDQVWPSKWTTPNSSLQPTPSPSLKSPSAHL